MDSGDVTVMTSSQMAAKLSSSAVTVVAKLSGEMHIPAIKRTVDSNYTRMAAKEILKRQKPFKKWTPADIDAQIARATAAIQNEGKSRAANGMM